MTQKEQIKLIQNAVGVTADGIIGPKTISAVLSKLGASTTGKESTVDKTKLIQKTVGATADGIIGPKTLSAIIAALKISTGADTVTHTTPAAAKKWPTQKEVRSGSSIFGNAGNEANLTNITPAYQLYYDGKPVKSVRVHKQIAEDVTEIFKEVLEAYGLEKIKKLGLDQYGGSYNFRKTTGGGSYSMHAWGIALDFAPDTNAMYTHAPKATLSAAECEKWWEIWESHGAVSMGRTYDKDWMHVQFARF